MKFDVVFLDALALFQRSPGGADAESHIPKRSRKIRNQWTKCLLRLLRAEQKQNIEIRVGKKQPPPISTQSHQAKPRRAQRMRLQRILKHLLRRVIGQRTQRQYCVACAHTRFELSADTLSLVIGLWAEDRLRGNGTLHVVYRLME